MQRRRWWIAIESIQLICSQHSGWVLSVLSPSVLLLRVHLKTFPYNFVASPPTLLAQTRQDYIE